MATSSSQTTKPVTISQATKLRHLKLRPFSKLADILNVENRWMQVAMRIKGPDKITDLFSASDISRLHDQWRRGGSPAEAFLQHWSTIGKPSEHPTIGDLLTILLDAELFLAADSISREVFDVPIPSMAPETRTEEVLAALTEATLKNISLGEKQVVDSDSHTSTQFRSDIEKFCVENVNHTIIGLLNFRYEYLRQVTKNFCDISVHYGGYKIGEGGFGTVYRAYVQDQWVAVKKLKNEVDKQFITELQCLRRFKHENLLPLFGFSNNGPCSCLVYLFMENGSLQERLCCLADSSPIPWSVRMSIACGAARGINYLHTFEAQPLVHRDIKSANVLLDKNFVPKVGDFGLARLGSSGQSSTAAFTSNILGTSVYMAPEAFHGEVSVKLDTFSFGVVLMELLTALAPYHADREEKDLVSYLEEQCIQDENIVTMLDVRAGNWDSAAAISLYKISKRCVERRKRDRPTITEVLPDIERLLNVCKNHH